MPSQNGSSKGKGAAINVPPQIEMFEAKTHWFHIFKAMIDNGDVAAMGPHTTTVYLVIKAHTNFSTGMSFPSIETISKKSGMSERQVSRALVTLENHGYILKEKKGRNNLYTLREKIEITDKQGRPQAVATWDYLPNTVQEATAEIKNLLLKGELVDGKVIYIEHLNVNMQINNEGGQGVQNNQPDIKTLKPNR